MSMLALEPRFMFDAAGAATGAEAATDAEAEAQASDQSSTNDAKASAKADAEAAKMDEALAGREAGRKELVIVDSSVADFQQLVDGVASGDNVSRHVVVLGEGATLDDLVAAVDGVAGTFDGQHIISHGSEGSIILGGETIDASDIAGNADAFTALGNKLTADGDILLYGCFVGTDGAGVDFINSLAEATGADIAASDDITGASGDYDFETRTGSIETEIALSDDVQDAYAHDLAGEASFPFNQNLTQVGGKDIYQNTVNTTQIQVKALNNVGAVLSVATGIAPANEFVDGDDKGTAKADGNFQFIKRIENNTFSLQLSFNTDVSVTGLKLGLVKGSSSSVIFTGFKDGVQVGVTTQTVDGTTEKVPGGGPFSKSKTKMTTVDLSALGTVDEVRVTAAAANANDINLYRLYQVDVAGPAVDPAFGGTFGAQTFTENGDPIAVAPAGTLSDPQTNTRSIKAQISANYQNGQDVLSIAPGDVPNGVTAGAFNAATGTLMLTSSANISNADVQAILRAVKFGSTSDAPGGNRTITFTAGDSESNTASKDVTVNITAKPDAPTGSDASANQIFTAGGAAVAIAPGAMIADPDGAITNANAKLIFKITSGLQAGTDRLVVPAEITAGLATGTDRSSVDGTLEISLANGATNAQVQAIARAVTFESSVVAPSETDRVFDVIFKDGTGTDEAAIDNILLIENLFSTGGSSSGFYAQSFTVEAAQADLPLRAITVVDLDGQTRFSSKTAGALTLEIFQGQTTTGTALYTQAGAILVEGTGQDEARLDLTGVKPMLGAGQYTFKLTMAEPHIIRLRSSLDNVSKYTGGEVSINIGTLSLPFGNNLGIDLSFKIDFGKKSEAKFNRTVAVEVPVEPIFSGTFGAQTYTEGGQAVTIAPAGGLKDLQNNIRSLKAQITANQQDGLDRLSIVQNGLPNGLNVGQFDSTSASLVVESVFNITNDNVQSILRAFQFTSSSDAPGTSRTITFTATDADGNTKTQDVTVNLTAVNDATALSANAGDLAAPNAIFNIGGNAVPIAPEAVLRDPDGPFDANARIIAKITDPRAGDVLAIPDGPFAGFAVAGAQSENGTLEISLNGATAAQAQAVLRAITFANAQANDQTGLGDRKISFDVLDGGTAEVSIGQAAGNASVDSKAVGQSFTISEDQAGSVLKSVTVSSGGRAQANTVLTIFANGTGQQVGAEGPIHTQTFDFPEGRGNPTDVTITLDKTLVLDKAQQYSFLLAIDGDGFLTPRAATRTAYDGGVLIIDGRLSQNVDLKFAIVLEKQGKGSLNRTVTIEKAPVVPTAPVFVPGAPGAPDAPAAVAPVPGPVADDKGQTPLPKAPIIVDFLPVFDAPVEVVRTIDRGLVDFGILDGSFKTGAGDSPADRPVQPDGPGFDLNDGPDGGTPIRGAFAVDGPAGGDGGPVQFDGGDGLGSPVQGKTGSVSLIERTATPVMKAVQNIGRALGGNLFGPGGFGAGAENPGFGGGPAAAPLFDTAGPGFGTPGLGLGLPGAGNSAAIFDLGPADAGQAGPTDQPDFQPNSQSGPTLLPPGGEGGLLLIEPRSESGSFGPQLSPFSSGDNTGPDGSGLGTQSPEVQPQDGEPGDDEELIPDNENDVQGFLNGNPTSLSFEDQLAQAAGEFDLAAAKLDVALGRTGELVELDQAAE